MSPSRLRRSVRCPRWFVPLICGLAITGCGEEPPYYDGTVAEWQRDSAMVDSLSRLVPTDSLYAAWRAVLVAQDLQAAHQRIACNATELRLRYGTHPAALAIERMEDTLWRGVDPELIRAHDARVPKAMELSVDEACGFPGHLWLQNSMPEAANRVDPRRRPGNLRHLFQQG